MTEDEQNIIERFSSVFKDSLGGCIKKLLERIECLPERITIYESRHPNAEQIRAIVGMPSPINTLTLRPFLRLIGYYNCFPPFLEERGSCIPIPDTSRQESWTNRERNTCHKLIYGRHFALLTDHMSLMSIFGSKQGVSTYSGDRPGSRPLVLVPDAGFNAAWRKGPTSTLGEKHEGSI
ncbi:hypothetical protein ACTXT7_005294 [Hymenolepis weldensis]